jgi:hypothetical protein
MSRYRVRGEQLIALYPHNIRCDQYVLVKPGRSYRIKHDHDITVESNSRKYLAPGYWVYVIEATTRSPTYMAVRPEWIGHKVRSLGSVGVGPLEWTEITLPLQGVYAVDPEYEEQFDELVRSQGYTIMCATIDEIAFPRMYRQLLRQPAIPYLKSYYLSVPHSPLLSMMPPELHGQVAEYVEKLATPMPFHRCSSPMLDRRKWSFFNVLGWEP